MSEQIGFRIKEGDNLTKKELDEQADKLDISRTDLIIKALEAITELDPEFIKQIDNIAEKVNLSFAEVIQGFVLNRLAEIDARREVWGSPTVLKELMRTNKGAPDTKYLYKTLKKQHKKPMIEEKIQGLLEKERAELKHNVDLLTEEEKQFLIEHKRGRTYYTSNQYKEEQARMKELEEKYGDDIEIEEFRWLEDEEE